MREEGTVTNQEHISTLHDIECTCKIQWYTLCMLSISTLGRVILVIFNARKLKLFRRHLFSHAVKNNAIYTKCSILHTSKVM